ncbi:MAG: glycosyltransferase family 2 protein [Egibacteraceae bacterium]
MVRWAALGAAALTAHSLLNLRLLRTPLCGEAPRPTCRGSSAPSGLVSVLVPARDEAGRIGPCIQALLRQRGADLELLVLDDGSTDGTADVVHDVAAGDPRVKILDGAPLPPGWLGKPHACAQLAEAARGDVLVFIDADVEVAPDGIAATVALLNAPLDRGRLDLVCPYPRQRAETVSERLVQPLLQWTWLTFLPLGLAERLRLPSLCAANGQLLACHAEAYRAVGGHAGVRGAVIEDVELARAFKRAGRRVAIADGTHVATCRMYSGWADLRDGYTKSLWAAFGSPKGAAGAVGLLAWLYVLPPAAAAVALARGRRRQALTGLAGYAAAAAGRAACARRTGSPPADALAHPVSVGVLVWLVARSHRHRAAGLLHWRGRWLE